MSEQTVFAFRYPFIREEYDDFDGEGMVKVKCWKPGVRFEDESNAYRETVHTYADGVGEQIITLVGRYTPPGYRERVFFTRQWKDPDGKLFGKKALQVKGVAAFSTLIKGYRYEFEMDAPGFPAGDAA